MYRYNKWNVNFGFNFKIIFWSDKLLSAKEIDIWIDIDWFINFWKGLNNLVIDDNLVAY